MRNRALVLSLIALPLCLSACASKRGPNGTAGDGSPAAESAFETGPEATVGSTNLTEDDRAAFARDVGERVYFALDSHELDTSARQVLSRQAAWLAARPGVSVLIEGHADERGTREYNLALGVRRAAAARDYLVQQGVSPARLDTISYGKERPIDPRSSEEGWSRNRNARTALGDRLSW
jgi:peptidoglycan-associated lipoprotein